MRDIIKEIDSHVSENKVVLYMKGSPKLPMCGFSAKAVKLLKECNVNDIYSVNVLEDEAIRQGVKEYSQWPTIPQLYINGEFIGGSDIIGELYESGELQQMLAS